MQANIDTVSTNIGSKHGRRALDVCGSVQIHCTLHTYRIIDMLRDALPGGAIHAALQLPVAQTLGVP